MQPLSDDIAEWCDETWGQSPSEVLEWFEDDERVQVFIKLQRSVLIADFMFKDNAVNMSRDRIEIRHHLHIPLDIWNPGSIQATRISDGRVRFRHRNSDILLAAKMRARMGQKHLGRLVNVTWGEQLRPKDKNQRLASIKRIKEIVNRNLHSASLEGARDDLHLINLRINSAEIGLNPFESKLQEAE